MAQGKVVDLIRPDSIPWGTFVLLYGNAPEAQDFLCQWVRLQRPEARLDRVSTTAEVSVASTPSLFEEIASPRRLIMVESVLERDAKAVQALLESLDRDTVVVGCSTFTKKSKLMAALQGNDRAIVVPVYALKPTESRGFVQALLAQKGVTLPGEEVMQIAALYAHRPSLLFQEIEKIALLLADDSNPSQTLAPYLSQAPQTSFDQSLFSFLKRDAGDFFYRLQRVDLQEEGMILWRSLLKMLCQLMDVLGSIQGGVSADQAVKSCVQPVFFMMEAPLRQGASLWTIGEVLHAMQLVQGWEKGFKENTLSLAQMQRQWGDIFPPLSTGRQA